MSANGDRVVPFPALNQSRLPEVGELEAFAAAADSGDWVVTAHGLTPCFRQT